MSLHGAHFHRTEVEPELACGVVHVREHALLEGGIDPAARPGARRSPGLRASLPLDGAAQIGRADRALLDEQLLERLRQQLRFARRRIFEIGLVRMRRVMLVIVVMVAAHRSLRCRVLPLSFFGRAVRRDFSLRRLEPMLVDVDHDRVVRLAAIIRPELLLLEAHAPERQRRARHAVRRRAPRDSGKRRHTIRRSPLRPRV